MDIKQRVKELNAIARGALTKDGRHSHIVIAADKEDNTFVCALIFETREEKQEVFRNVISKFKASNIIQIFEICEIWIARRKEDDKHNFGNLMPSISPDREEALMVLGCDKDSSYAIINFFDKKKNKINFIEEHIMNSEECTKFDSHWDPLFK